MDDTPDILTLRDELGWSQAEMADYLGLDRSTVSRLENGGTIKKPVRELLKKLRVDRGSALIVPQATEAA